jgi:glycosyltransferase involved in cell wall biosynthesis
MRALFFSPFSPDADGGAERVARRLAADLQDRGHAVYRVFRGEIERRLPTSAVVGAWETPLEHLRTWHKLPRPGSLIRMARSVCRLHRILKHVRPDVVNCHFANFSSLYFLLLRPVHGYRLVVSTHGSDVLVPLSAVHRLILPFLLRRACHVTAVSRSLLDAACEVAPIREHASTIFNGIDYAFWNQGSVAPQPAPDCASPDAQESRASVNRTVGDKTGEDKTDDTGMDGPIIVNVGTLRRVKGQDVLLEAFARLRESFPSARLRLVGDGNDRDALTARAERLGVRDRVVFCGWCDREEVRRLLKTSTVFAYPSRSEGFGLALLEAMAAGLPVVATRVGGIPDVVASSNSAQLVPPESPGALADALAGLLSDSDRRRRMGRDAAGRAQEFRWSHTVDQYDDLFRRLV